MARPERFELPTARFVAGYSIQLSYGRAVIPHKAVCLARGANYPCEALDCQPFRALFYICLRVHHEYAMNAEAYILISHQFPI